MSLGGTVVIAVLFAQPLATFLVISAYEERLLQTQAVATPVPPAAPAPPPPPPPAAE